MDKTSGQLHNHCDQLEDLHNRVDAIRHLSHLVATGMANTACSFEEIPPMQVHAFAAIVGDLLDCALADTGYPYR